MGMPFSLLKVLDGVKGKNKPPIHLWNPKSVKEIDLVIRKNGDWYHEGGLIKRHRLVHLFASVLRLENDGCYYLITPVEKCKIVVEDVPFMMILMDVGGEDKEQEIVLTSNMADTVEVSGKNPIRLVIDAESDEPTPYIEVRDGLLGKLNRNVYYQLANLMIQSEIDGKNCLGVWSCGDFIPMHSFPIEGIDGTH